MWAVPNTPAVLRSGWSATLTVGLVPVSPSLRRKRDEGCYSCTTASPLVGRALDWTKLKCLLRLCPFAPASLTGTVWNKDSGARCYSGATRSAGCLLAGYLFHHLLLHFLRCGSCDVGSDHPSVTLGIDNGSTAVAPKHIHHGSLGRGAELYGLGNRLVCVHRQQIQTRRRGADCFRAAEAHLRHFRSQH